MTNKKFFDGSGIDIVNVRDIIDIPILKKEFIISEYQIFSYYLGRDFKSGVVMNSPLRQDDKPSFSIFTDRKGTLRFKDFGTGDTGDCFTLI